MRVVSTVANFHFQKNYEMYLQELNKPKIYEDMLREVSTLENI